MRTYAQEELEAIIGQFRIEGRLSNAVPYGTGHINDTYASAFRTATGEARYIHQRINGRVFLEPEKLMENIERVTSHTRARVIEAGGDPSRETLNLVPSIDGHPFHRSAEGDYWRTYLFIEGAKTYDRVIDPLHVYYASKAFGTFQKMLSSLSGERLHETIPFFHHTRKRFDALVAAADADTRSRAAAVKNELEFAFRRESDVSIIVDRLASGELPERVIHNDTKLNNVMIDDGTGEGVCIIDLDTVMPGSVLYDFGDSVRIGTSTAAEDERDISKVGVDMDMFDRLAHGYLDAARDFIVPAEVDLLAFSGKLLTFECGMRFLTDYLRGDEYFKTSRPEQNLDRCRTQFKMVAEMDGKTGKMEKIIEAYRRA